MNIKTYHVKYRRIQLYEGSDEFTELDGGYIDTVAEGENKKEAAENLALKWENKKKYSKKYGCKQSEVEFELYKPSEDYDDYTLDIKIKNRILEFVYIEVGGESTKTKEQFIMEKLIAKMTYLNNYDENEDYDED